MSLANNASRRLHHDKSNKNVFKFAKTLRQGGAKTHKHKNLNTKVHSELKCLTDSTPFNCNFFFIKGILHEHKTRPKWC